MTLTETSCYNPTMGLRPRYVHNISKPQAIENMLRTTVEQQLLQGGEATRSLPCTLMYDEAGLDLWAKIIELPDYYIPGQEMDALSKWGKGMVQQLGAGTALIDLGSGDVRKVIGLLGEFEKAEVLVYYFALDMSAEKLQESMRRIPSSWRYVQPFALCGTFEEARAWSHGLTVPKCFLCLGGTMGNDEPGRMAEEFKLWASALRRDDRMLLGLDSTQDDDTVLAAYNDAGDIWHSFIRNGFVHSNSVLGADWFNPEEWRISGTIKRGPYRHQFEAVCQQQVNCSSLGLKFEAGDRIVTYPSYKYTPTETADQFAAAGLETRAMWRADGGPVYQYLLARCGDITSKLA